MKYKKILKISLMILLVIFLNININAEDKTISVYYEEYNELAVAAISRYKQLYPDIRVEEVVTKFSMNDNYTIAEDLLSGNAPDIIIFDSIMIDDILNLIKSGVFCDLNEIVNNDLYNQGELNQVVYNSGLIYGKRFFIPLSYSLPIVASTKETLEKNNIIMSDFDYSQSELADYLTNYLVENPNKYFTKLFLEIWLEASGFFNVSYDSFRIGLSEEELLESLQIMKDLMEYRNIESNDSVNIDEISMFLDEKILAYRMLGIDEKHLLETYNWIKAESNQHIQLVPFPMAKQSKYIAKVEDMVAVSITAEKNDPIANFIKVLLSDEIQKYYVFNGLPVKQSALNYSIETAKDQSDDKVLHELLEDLKIISEKIEYSNIRDQVLIDLIYEYTYDYLNEKINKKEFIEEVNFEIQKYFME